MSAANKETMISLKVSNLSRKLLEGTDEIKSLFSAYGEVGDVYIPAKTRDDLKSAHFRNGYCFVRYKEKADADKALEGANGKEVDGNRLSIALSEPMTRRNLNSYGASFSSSSKRKIAEFCRDFKKSTGCKFGDDCRYAHSDGELRRLQEKEDRERDYERSRRGRRRSRSRPRRGRSARRGGGRRRRSYRRRTSRSSSSESSSRSSGKRRSRSRSISEDEEERKKKTLR